MPVAVQYLPWFNNKSKTAQDGKEPRGFPCLVSRQNEVLRDSLSVDYAGLVQADLYREGLKSPANDPYGYSAGFYMNSRGRAYRGHLVCRSKEGLPQRGRK